MEVNPKSVPRGRLVPNPKARLREQFHEVARYRQLSLRTEEAYWGWVGGVDWQGSQGEGKVSFSAQSRDSQANKLI